MLLKRWKWFLWLKSSTSLTDRMILIIAVMFVGWSYFYYWKSNGQSATYAMIFSPYQAPQRIMLNVSQRLSIQGRVGQSVIEVVPQQIRFVASPCQGKQCVHAGWLRGEGELAACLPNQVSIGLYGDGKFDAVAY